MPRKNQTSSTTLASLRHISSSASHSGKKQTYLTHMRFERKRQGEIFTAALNKHLVAESEEDARTQAKRYAAEQIPGKGWKTRVVVHPEGQEKDCTECHRE